MSRSSAPPQQDVESVVRDRLYGARRDVTPTATRLGARYRLLEPIGRGGTADVFRARDERLHRDVAAKVIERGFTHDAASVRRFRREATLLARLAHPNIARVFDAGSRPREYIVTELVEGHDAFALLRRQEPPNVADVVAVLVQVCDALEHAHGRGVLHGDIAPRNIVIAQRGGTAKLIDFGIAVDRFAARQEPVTMGTPGYVAPEVISGGRPSVLSELYSLGAVAYRLLGGPPIGGRGHDTTAALPTAVSMRPSLAQVRPDLPCILTAAVDRAMARCPVERPASAAELRDALLGATVATTHPLAA